MSSRLSLRQVLAAAVFTVPALSFAAYPDHPMEWVVPYAAGGGSDVVARVVAEPMAKALGQSIIIINKPGAATNIGADYAARAKPDGYTMLTGDTGTLAANPYLYKKLSYSAEKDFATVGMLVRFPMILVVNPKLPIKNLQEFEAWAKAQGGGVSYATPGAGSPHHLAMEMFKLRTGTFMTHIPYRGAAPAMQDVMGGQVPCMFLDLAAGLPVIQSGKVRALAIGSSKRMAALPDVPTLAEAGVPDTEVFAFQGILAPAGLPAAITTRLNADLNKALLNPAVVKRMNDFGMEALPGTPEQFRAMARAESKRWGEIIKAAGVKLD